MDKQHPFPFNARVQVRGTSVAGTVVGFWYDEASVSIRIRYVDQNGALQHEWIEGHNALPLD